MLRSLTTVFLTLTLSLLLASCGGGGGSIEPVHPGTPLTIPSGSQKQKTFTVGELRIDVPAGSFPQGGTLWVENTTGGSIPTLSGVELALTNSTLKITSSVSASGSINITLASTKTTRGGGFLCAYLYKTALGLWDSLNDLGTQVDNSMSIVIDKTKLIAGKTIIGTLVKILITAPTEETELVQFGTNSLGQKRILLGVHGANETAEALRSIQNYLLENSKSYEVSYEVPFRYCSAVGFGYDWTNDLTLSAQSFGKLLDSYDSQGYAVDIVAHSMGAPVVRWTLERLGKTNAVRNVFLICGANEGTIWANIPDILRGLRLDFLNRHGAGLPLGLASYDSQAIRQLIPRGDFLTRLNMKENQHRGHANYYCFGTTRDWVVGLTSGRADDVPLNMLTAGTVNRYTMDGDHGSLIETEAGVKSIFSQTLDTQMSQMLIVYDPSWVVADYDRWNTCCVITNQSDYYNMTIRDLTFDRFNGYTGLWDGCSWYDPSTPVGTLFPKEYAYWGKVLKPRESIRLYVRHLTDSNGTPIDLLPESEQSNVVMATVRFSLNDSYEQMEKTLCICGYGDVWPGQIDWRSMPLPTRGSSKSALVLSGK